LPDGSGWLIVLAFNDIRPAQFDVLYKQPRCSPAGCV
jgi:hypothetical protein